MNRLNRVGTWGAAIALSLSFVLFALAGLYTVRQAHRVDEQLCKQTVDNREAQRRTWIAAQTFILRGQSNEEAQVITKDFFQAVLTTIPSLQCVDRKPMEVEG